MTSLRPTPWTDDDAEPAWRRISDAFAEPGHPADRAVELAVVDPARFLVVRDAGAVVATSGTFALEMSLPGRPAVPVAGVSWVSVEATHRRTGLLRAMVDRLLHDAHERGEAVAALHASEAAIYQRFGFGPASWVLSLELPRGAALVHPVVPGGLRRAEPTPELLAPVWDRVCAGRAGSIRRDEGWWAMRLHDPEHARRGASALRCVLTQDGAGYALYAVKNHPTVRAEVVVAEVAATDPGAYARLWAFLLDHDLTASVSARVPVDDPLLQLLAEPRAAGGRLRDALWVRPVEVGGALSARAYATEVDVVLEVSDATCPWNAGRWRLGGGPDGAVCSRTTDPAELALDVADLGAALLGGTSLQQRAGAGRVQELRAGALQRASTAFGPVGPGPFDAMSF